jgi:hypothetical protein
VKTLRRECLDHLLIFAERPLQGILREYLRHHNEERPHRGLSLETPEPGADRKRSDGAVVRVDRLGGLIHEYYRTAACIGINAPLSLVGRMSAFGRFRGGSAGVRGSESADLQESSGAPAGIEPATPGLGIMPQA